jgi:polyhydroxyalkanoate synthesis regulator phasin
MAAEIAGEVLVEVAKPVYGTLRQIYHTKNDRKQFRAILKDAGKRGGMTEEEADRVSKEVTDEMEAAQKGSSTRIKKFFWPLRVDRGPGIDRLPTDEFREWLDHLYRQATTKLAIEGAPVSISAGFMLVLGDGFKPQQPAKRAEYARKLLGILQRNDREYKSYLSSITVLAGGLASTGIAGALAEGARGAADADLKTALTAAAGITVTALLGTLTHTLENRQSPRQAEAQQSDKEGTGV